MIHRFQDRGETDRQFRAMLSGVLGLVMIVALCSCMGVVTTVANNTLATVNAARDSGTTSQNTNTGTGQVQALPTFPTATVPPWPQSGPPTYGVIPNSQTPVPSPSAEPTATELPTATPCQTGCSGGGGGGGGSFGATVTGSPSPALWKAGSAASFTVHSNPGGVGLAIIISFPGGVPPYLDENGEMTDGSGNYTSHFTVPGGTSAGTADVYIQAYYNGVKKDFHFGVTCTP